MQYNPVAQRGLLGVSRRVGAKRKRVERNPNYGAGNYDYPKRDLDAAKQAAEWEGVTITDYFRSALKLRLRETEIKRAEFERRLKGKPDV
jgi:hypothetical protein